MAYLSTCFTAVFVKVARSPQQDLHTNRNRKAAKLQNQADTTFNELASSGPGYQLKTVSLKYDEFRAQPVSQESGSRTSDLPL
jgi:hypothetical protein